MTGRASFGGGGARGGGEKVSGDVKALMEVTAEVCAEVCVGSWWGGCQ